MPRTRRAITTAAATARSRKAFPSLRFCAACVGDTATNGTRLTRQSAHAANDSDKAASGHQCHIRKAPRRAATASAWPNTRALREMRGEYE